jgi:hypothetical protein
MTRVRLRVTELDRIRVGVDDAIVKEWIRGRMSASIDLFRAKMNKPSPSSPFSYPANVTGQMSANIRGPFLHGFVGRVDMSAYNKDGVDYVPFHRKGTKRMSKRKLVNDALFEVLLAKPEKRQLASAATFGYAGGSQRTLKIAKKRL